MKDLDLFVSRQRNKVIRFGHHTCERAFGLGISTAGSYIHMGGNVETAKRQHRDMLDRMREMPKPKLPS